jgi:hypothetical protein
MDIVNFFQDMRDSFLLSIVSELNYFYCEFDRIVDRYGIEKKDCSDSYVREAWILPALDPANIVLAALKSMSLSENIRKSMDSAENSTISMRIEPQASHCRDSRS